MPNAPHRATVRRRAILAAALAGSLGSLTGCGIRLESDAPHIPGIKTQGPPPDQKSLRRLQDELDAAIRAAGDTASSESNSESSAWASKLATLHRTQRRRLAAVMATQGMTPVPTASPSSRPNTDLGPLHSVEQEAARGIGSLASLSARNLPMAASIAVTQSAGADLLGHPVEPSGCKPPNADQVTAILPSLRAAIYALEEIIAKTPLKDRKRAEATLTPLRATRATWEASLGKDVPQSPDGFALPVQPTTDARRRTLAQRVLTDLIDACAGQVVATRADRSAFVGLSTLWADATAQLWRWGATPTAFPGLSPVE